MTSFEKIILKRYRFLNKQSRAVKLYTLYGSGSAQRRATCIFCRNIIATCSNNWPETVSFIKTTEQHTKKCAMLWYFSGQADDIKKLLY